MSDKYLRIPIIVTAIRWYKNGDHPLDGDERFPADSMFAGEKLEGKVVRYFRHPEIPGEFPCPRCDHTMHNHGWIEGEGNGWIVCPGDYVVEIDPGKFVAYDETMFKTLFVPLPEGVSTVPIV